jgi:hypothetical protein
VPQVLVWVKSAAFAPTIVTAVMLTVAWPLLLSVTVLARLVVLSGWLPKLTLSGAS